ncbi:chromosome segregation SMC [Chlorella sorokiniana]|uniref:Chromosome segregation SMC n=1 Tax=Chlorella sorokiniana TaxID=3076 RepID=A0A2P6TIT7_CHLSO|nr:chromosome segregation SMC [Chlorella sorokiniana]|eukprot:PRW39163.1 chromosome segregation SMC [Chlorella sorokiniana]
MGQWISTSSAASTGVGHAPRRRPRSGESSEPAARQLSIQDLPDSLLGHVLALAADDPQLHHRVLALTLVCRRWNDVLRSPCAALLWHTFALKEQADRHHLHLDVDARYGAKLRLLEAVAPAVHALEIHQGSPDLAERSCATVAGFLAACDPAALRCVMLHCDEQLPLSALATLRTLSALQQLELHERRLQQATVDLLPHLPQLRGLHFCAYHAFPDGLLDAVLNIKPLTKLGLVCNEPLPSDCSRLTALSGLTALTLMQALKDWAPPPPASFPALELYLLESQMSGMQLGGATLRRCHLSLEDGSGRQAARHAHNSSGGTGQRQGSSGSTICRHLSIEGTTSMPSLQAFLDAVLPPGPPLHALTLFAGDGIQPAAAAGTTALASLHTLTLQQLYVPADGSLAALLPAAPNLRDLQLKFLDCESDSNGLPACVRALTCLTRLEHRAYNSNPSWDLPPGPYLAGLRELVLWRCSLADVPAAVRAATQLTLLDLRCNPLERLDVALLRRLPALKQLGVDCGRHSPLQKALDRVLADRRHVRLLTS